MMEWRTRASAHMVVCTLCSCYPWPVLGLPPTWYKSAPYRSRAVRDPRGVLAEFGVTLPESTSIRVWDSTAEVRYLVLPMRPDGTEDLSEEELAALVTRDSMIGTGSAAVPPARRPVSSDDVRHACRSRRQDWRHGPIVNRARRRTFPRGLGAARAGASRWRWAPPACGTST